MNRQVTIKEIFNGFYHAMELAGLNFKGEMKSNLNIIAEIIEWSGKDVKIPTCKSILVRLDR